LIGLYLFTLFLFAIVEFVSWRAFSAAIAAILAVGIPNFPSLIAAWTRSSPLYI
jgi:hypothetical protein